MWHPPHGKVGLQKIQQNKKTFYDSKQEINSVLIQFPLVQGHTYLQMAHDNRVWRSFKQLSGDDSHSERLFHL